MRNEKLNYTHFQKLSTERKMLISGSQSELKRMQFTAEVDGNIRVSLTSRKRMEDSECWRAVGRIEAGQSTTDVALFFGVHHSVISRLWKQFQTTQTVVRRPVGGRPRVTTPAEDQYIAIVAKRNRRAISTRVTSMVTASIGKAISAATVRRRLYMNGLYDRVPRVCVPLSVQSRGA
ncbi:HTH_Tnp_Tc3_2 domain-containing protein [Trichonephila clavipes]|nr:HTH_Tnp_Tc3_2 domain-containing protein [Trichonephila clavipes]